MFRDGLKVGQGVLPDIAIGPGETKQLAFVVDNAFFQTSIADEGTLTIDLEWRLKHDESWARAGHLVAFDQLLLHEGHPPVHEAITQAIIKVEEDDEKVTISSKTEMTSWTLVVKKDTNDTELRSVRLSVWNLSCVPYRLKSFFQQETGDKSAVIKGLTLNLWRAPTDNDHSLGLGPAKYTSLERMGPNFSILT